MALEKSIILSLPACERERRYARYFQGSPDEWTNREIFLWNVRVFLLLDDFAFSAKSAKIFFIGAKSAILSARSIRNTYVRSSTRSLSYPHVATGIFENKSAAFFCQAKKNSSETNCFVEYIERGYSPRYYFRNSNCA